LGALHSIYGHIFSSTCNFNIYSVKAIKEVSKVENAALIMSVTALTITAYQIGVEVSNWKYQKLMSSLAKQLRKEQNDFFIRMWEFVFKPDIPFSDNWKWKEAKKNETYH
jgi:hypothetical protein